MSQRSLLSIASAVFGAAAILGAQDAPKPFDRKTEPPPKTEDWLRNRRINRAPMVVTVKPAPEEGPKAGKKGTCAIPLLSAMPVVGGAVRQMVPDDRGTIRVIEPEVCDNWNKRRGDGPITIRRAAPR